MILKPEEDGVTHINVYSQGKTQLGRQLSNFAWTPFKFDGYEFASVEAWWYWNKCVKLIKAGYKDKITISHLKKLREYHGIEAKKWGKVLLMGCEDMVEENTLEELKNVYIEKLRCVPFTKKRLIENQLPLEHYYVYGNIVREADKYLWTVKLWEQIKEEIKQQHVVSDKL